MGLKFTLVDDAEIASSHLLKRSIVQLDKYELWDFSRNASKPGHYREQARWFEIGGLPEFFVIVKLKQGKLL